MPFEGDFAVADFAPKIDSDGTDPYTEPEVPKTDPELAAPNTERVEPNAGAEDVVEDSKLADAVAPNIDLLTPKEAEPNALAPLPNTEEEGVEIGGVPDVEGSKADGDGLDPKTEGVGIDGATVADGGVGEGAMGVAARVGGTGVGDAGVVGLVVGSVGVDNSRVVEGARVDGMVVDGAGLGRMAADPTTVDAVTDPKTEGMEVDPKTDWVVDPKADGVEVVPNMDLFAPKAAELKADSPEPEANPVDEGIEMLENPVLVALG